MFRYEIFVFDMNGIKRKIFKAVDFCTAMEKLLYYRSLRPKTRYVLEMCF